MSYNIIKRPNKIKYTNVLYEPILFFLEIMPFSYQILAPPPTRAARIFSAEKHLQENRKFWFLLLAGDVKKK